jgi:hypothetical protein
MRFRNHAALPHFSRGPRAPRFLKPGLNEPTQRHLGQPFRGCCPIRRNTGSPQGHEDKSFEQELTEEPEDNPRQFLASGRKSLTSVASLSSCSTHLSQCPVWPV